MTPVESTGLRKREVHKAREKEARFCALSFGTVETAPFHPEDLSRLHRPRSILFVLSPSSSCRESRRRQAHMDVGRRLPFLNRPACSRLLPSGRQKQIRVARGTLHPAVNIDLLAFVSGCEAWAGAELCGVWEIGSWDHGPQRKKWRPGVGRSPLVLHGSWEERADVDRGGRGQR